MAVSEKPVVLVDDEDQILLSYSTILKTAGMDNIVTIQDSKKVMPFLTRHEASVMVIDLIMPQLSGVDLLNKIKNEYPHIPVIVMTATNDIEMAVNCMKEGAIDYLVKPVEKNRFISSVKNALDIQILQDEVCNLKNQLLSERLHNREAFSSILTNSRKMISLFHYVEAIAGSDRPVCICGETGVGKELLARAVYEISGLDGEFIAVNVAGLDDTMFSDTLFGHKKGAYSGADNDRDGLIAKAAGGALMLDEIGDLNENSQLKLLRLLEERQYYPLGSDISQMSNVQIIATTNKNLKSRVSEGKFRKDLYYRLCTHLIEIPALRERLEDIPLLVDHFLDEASRSLSKKKPYYPNELITLLSGYHFPGNIRELQTLLVDAVARHKSGKLSMNAFKKIFRHNDVALQKNVIPDKNDELIGIPGQSGNFPTLKESEAYLISEALKRSDGNQRRAAEMLGISRQALNKRLKRAEQS